MKNSIRTDISCPSGSFPILNGERPPMRFMMRRLPTDILPEIRTVTFSFLTDLLTSPIRRQFTGIRKN